jgi:hypothetical protein
MTTHELARLLLEGPDVPVCVAGGAEPGPTDSWEIGPEDVTRVAEGAALWDSPERGYGKGAHVVIG